MKRWRGRRRTAANFARDEQGAAMIEFAIVVSLLLVVVFGMIDYGRYFLSLANLTNAVRDGARYAATLTETAADTVLMRSYTRARINGTATQQSSGSLAVSFSGTSGLDRAVTVKITNYPFTPATFLVIKSAKTITASATFRREQP
jgi:Flp pilus assembly protein TadG